MGRVKQIWYLSPMRAAKVQAKVGEIILSEKNVQEDYFTFAKLKAWSQANQDCVQQLSWDDLFVSS